MKAGFLITARLKSTRLPMKLLKKVKGKEIIRQMIDRIKEAKAIEEIIICTSTNSQDDRLELIAKEEGIKCFRGDEDDVIKRLYEAAIQFKLDYVVNVTADCPLVEPEYIDKIVEEYAKDHWDYISCEKLPHGSYSYGLDIEAMKKIIEMKNTTQTEVWGVYFTETNMFKIKDLEIKEEHIWPELRMTLDYQEDLDFLKRVFDELYIDKNNFTLDAIIKLLKDNPEIQNINKHCEKKYLENIQKQTTLKLKGE